MSSLLPAALRPPNLARTLRVGRCAEGIVLWLSPAASQASPTHIDAWWAQLRAASRARGLSSVPVWIVQEKGADLRGFAFQPGLSPVPEPSRWESDGRTCRRVLDALPEVCTVEPGPYDVQEDPDDDDDFRDIFEDYAELSGMSRDDWLLSVD